MRISKYLLGIWVAVAVYTLFSFLSGPKGMSAYNYLLSEREQQRYNIQTLGIINEELEKTRNNLLYDPDTLLIHARQMGYGSQDERFVRIVGLGINRTSPATAGNVYFAQNPDYISDRIIKIISLSLGLLVFAFFFTIEFLEKRTN
ncbi:MAG: septum formation initiator family protein [Treponema sp.]|nr:septum formation initiator family protein [Treponema sp.]